jgi:hypothetical protein
LKLVIQEIPQEGLVRSPASEFLHIDKSQPIIF